MSRVRALLARPFVVAHRALFLAAVLLIVASLALLAVFLFEEETAERYTAGRRPAQFYRGLDADLLDDYGGVFGVAHNSGDSLAATSEALAHGADVIEIDVVAMNGRLYAAHDVPARWVGPRVFRGPALEAVWAAATATDVVKLDLKESSSSYLELVLAFLAEHRGEHQVIVATRDVGNLRAVADREPEAFRLLSVADRSGVRALQDDPALVALVDGVTILQSLLDGPTAAWLEERGLIVVAWTVNDLARVNELVRLGVDGITTDNLAIMELLGGQERGERRLVRRPPDGTRR